MEPEAAVLTVDVTRGAEADTIVTITGDLDLGSVATVIGAIDEIFAESSPSSPSSSPSPSSVTLDLAGITFLDSSGLGALLTLHARCQSEGIPFSAINPPAQVCRLLELTNLTEMFNFH